MHHLFRILFLLLATGTFKANAQWVKKADKTGLCGTQSLNAVVAGNLCYIGAGYSENCPQWYSYNPATDIWLLLSPYPGGNNVQSVGFAVNGKIYVGIGDNPQSPSRCDNKLYEYTPSTNTWVYKTTMPGVKKTNCASFVIGNYAYIGLGTDSSYNNRYKDFYKYDPAANTWSQIAPFPDSSIFGVSSFNAAGKGYITGGLYPSSHLPGSNGWRYDPGNNTWSSVAQVPASKVFAASTAVLNDVPFICMGLGTQPGNVGRKNLYRYNISANTWAYVDSLPDDRTWDEGIGFSLNGKLYFGLGDDPSPLGGLVNPMMWEYNPGPTGVQEHSSNVPEFIAFPSPAHGSFRIKLAAGQTIKKVELLTATGQLIKSWDAPLPLSTFDYGSVPPGSYYVCLALPDGTIKHARILIE